LCFFLGIAVLLRQKAILRVGPLQWEWIKETFDTPASFHFWSEEMPRAVADP